MLFKWRHHKFGDELWKPDRFFETYDGQPRDYLTLQERQKIREAALEYGAIPGYNDLSPEQRDRWKAYLAQRFGKPKSEVSPSDWDRANGWKVPSLVSTSLDAGLRPVEVERVKVSWVDTGNSVLRIPYAEAAKSRDNWVAALSDRTVLFLTRWLEERDNYSRYEGRDELWLTKHGNPYQSQSLRHLLRRLCEVAGIETENRQMSWYAIRHSTGTYMTREEDLKAAAAQLRHKSISSTMRYDQAPLEDRKDALERMG